MTAYVVLLDHPLTPGRNGPTIVVSAAEAASYARRRAEGESLVKVAAGERISLRRALQGLLLASGNNMADILARWDAGNIPAFVARMNETADLLGMTATHYADASGLDARSRSTAADLLKLAPAAMADPSFATIVSQTSATIPLNKIKNTNKLLGRHGVIGIKTGSTRAAGGCLLFAAERTVAGQVYRVYGALLGAPGPRILTNALAASDALIVAARKSLRPAVLIPGGETLATVTTSDGKIVNLTVAEDLAVVGWTGLTYTLSLPPGLSPGEIPSTLIASTSAQSITVPLIEVAQVSPGISRKVLAAAA
jgi:D-alanyl-D-alanine carboxypeptidase (penicillin-binding protein 5/6)